MNRKKLDNSLAIPKISIMYVVWIAESEYSNNKKKIIMKEKILSLCFFEESEENFFEIFRIPA